MADADSIAVDPHKWLYAPLEAGCALVKDPAGVLRAATNAADDYLNDLDGRQILDEAIAFAPPRQSAPLYRRLALADSRFHAIRPCCLSREHGVPVAR